MSSSSIIEALVECLTGLTGSVDRPHLEAAWVEAEKMLQAAGRTYFVDHINEDRAPYAVYVAADPIGRAWRLVVCVGQQQIDAGRQGAYAQIVSGELGRNIVRRHAG